MHQMAKKYLREDVSVEYSRSLFAIKPLLQLSDLDDSRPTLVRTLSAEPGFTTVLSGKINTMYDLDVLLDS